MDTLPPLIVNSLPKSGSHLLTRVVEGLPRYRHCGFYITREMAAACHSLSSPYLVGAGGTLGMQEEKFEELIRRIEPGAYALAHLPHTPETEALLTAHGIYMIIILRDPRDVVCSLAHYAGNDVHHRLHDHFKSLPDIQARIRAAIAGVRPDSENDPARLLPINERLRAVSGWTRWKNTCTVLFEHLIGARGGGDDTLQMRAVSSVLNHLGYDLAKAKKQALCASIFSQESATFRRGQIGGWRSHFTPELERYFHEQAGEALEHYLAIARRLHLEINAPIS